MTYAEAAEILWRDAMKPIAASLQGRRAQKRAEMMRPQAAAFLLRWCDEPGLDLAAVDPDARGVAVLMLSEIIMAWADDHERAAAPLLASTQDATVRNLLRDEIQRAIAQAKGLH